MNLSERALDKQEEMVLQ